MCPAGDDVMAPSWRNPALKWWIEFNTLSLSSPNRQTYRKNIKPQLLNNSLLHEQRENFRPVDTATTPQHTHAVTSSQNYAFTLAFLVQLLLFLYKPSFSSSPCCAVLAAAISQGWRLLDRRSGIHRDLYGSWAGWRSKECQVSHAERRRYRKKGKVFFVLRFFFVLFCSECVFLPFQYQVFFSLSLFLVWTHFQTIRKAHHHPFEDFPFDYIMIYTHGQSGIYSQT